LRSALDALRDSRGLTAVIVAVNDGSTDRSAGILAELSATDPTLRVLDLERNRGQHEAVIAGFAASTASLVVTIDADLQNPPEEIPRIVERLLAGHDLVATRRVHREDSLARRVMSLAANWITATLSRAYNRVALHDIGCMLRGYRRELVEAMVASATEPGAPAPFIPALALRHARRVCEIAVAHAPRVYGQSRYGWLDLVRLQGRLIATLIRPSRNRQRPR